VQGIGSSAGYLAASWKLANDIDASGTANWNAGDGFRPIQQNALFTGTLDGDNHVISHLSILAPPGNAGLFAQIGSSGTVKNLGITDATVGSSNTAGILAGGNDGTVTNVWTSGTLTGTGISPLGGLVGINDGTISGSWSSSTVNAYSRGGGLVGMQTGGSVTSSYATGAVQGTADLGGLVGSQWGGSLINVYATGAVSGSYDIGGLVGSLYDGSISYAYATGKVTGDAFVGGLVGAGGYSVTNSFWDINTTGQSSSNAGTGLTTAQARSAASYTGWDFTNVWYQSGDMRPILRSEAATADSNGIITISNLHQLALINTNLAGKYVLAANLDASATKGLNAADIWGAGGWVPVGNGSSEFTGTFDGQNHTIANLTINRPGENAIGLFGATNDASIANIGLIGGSVSGGRYTGGLVGNLGGGTVSNAYNTGTVSGDWYVGGLIGASANGINFTAPYHATISNVHATGDVSGTNFVGGLIGWIILGDVRNAYATGAVTGVESGADTGMYIGGLIGWLQSATLNDAYATGSVTGVYKVGGLLGQAGGTSTFSTRTYINNVYATGAVTGDTRVGGLVGHLGFTASLTNSYASGAVSGNDIVGGLIGMLGKASDITGSFWNTTTSGQSSGCGAVTDISVCTSTGLTTAQMADPFKYIDAGWNFASTWASLKTGGAPVLRSLTTDPVYTYYVRLTGDSTTTYGDTIDTSAIAVDGIGAGNVSVAWGSAIGATTNAGTYGYGGSNVVSLSYSAGVAGDYYVGSAGSLIINKRVVSLDGTRTYDGTTNVGAGALTIGNLANGETLTLAGIGQLSGKNVGTGLGFGLGTLALGNGTGLASNYTLTGSTRTVDTTKAVITAITGITADNKTYDATTAATLMLSGAGFTGMASGDALTVATATGAFTDKNAGTGKTVNISGLTLGGTDAGNYTLSTTTASTTADIAKAVITSIAGITATNKTYDGTDAAALVLTGATFNGRIGTDVLTVATSSGAFSDKNAATGKTVNITGLSLGGTDAGNYTLSSTTASTTADIAKAVITSISGITASNKTYDGTDAATLVASSATYNGMVSGDVLTVATGVGAFADKNAATGKTVNISGLTLGGTDAGNYTLSTTTASTTADIAKAIITSIAGITATNKTYDGTTDATLVLTGASFNGKLSGDVLTVATASAAFSGKDVGTGLTVGISGLSLGGADAGNYTLSSTTASTTANIVQRVLSLSGGRTYDGTTDIAADILTLGNLVSGETLVMTGAGQLSSKDAGAGLVFGLGTLALGNGSGTASNYTLTGGATSVDIAKAVLTLYGFTAASKTYDGTTTASILSLGTLGGVFGADSVSFSATGATFADKNAGTGKTVTLNGITLSGADAGNYTLGSGTTTTADIAKAVITSIAGITAANKPYDGNTSAALVTTGAVFNGVLAGDLLSVASGTGAFADSNSGNGKRVNITGLSLGGLDARNYTLASTTATTTADINASVAPVLPPPNTIDTGTSAINSIGSTVRASFVVSANDAFAQPDLIAVDPPRSGVTGTPPETRKRRDDDQ